VNDLREITCSDCENKFFIDWVDLGPNFFYANYCPFCGVRFKVHTGECGGNDDVRWREV